MKRRYLFLIALCVLAAFFAAVVPWTISTDPVARQVASHVRALTGLELVVEGRSTLAVLPVPRIKLEQVTLTSANGEPVVRARQLRGEIRLLPLLTGQIELADATLLEPTLFVASDESGRSPWGETLRRLAATVQSAPRAGGSHVRRLIIADGTLVQGRGEGSDELFRDVNMVLNWPTSAGALGAAGTVSWRGQPVEVRMTDVSPARLLAGQASDVTLRVKAVASTLALSGEIVGGGDPQFEGDLSFTTTSLRDTERWLQTGLAIATLVESFSLKGPVTATLRELSLPSAAVMLGKDALEGALAARWEDGRLGLSGTLAAETLDFTRLLSPMRPAQESDGGWSREPIRAGAFAAADLDLRFSASAARIGPLALSAVAAGIILKNGRLEIALGRAVAYKGAVKGRFSLASTPTGVEAKLQGSFEQVDLAAALAAALNSRRMSGAGQAQIAVEAEGASVADLARSLTGKASISVKQGEIARLDLAEAVRRSERRPLSAAIDWRAGRTPFDQLSGTLAITNGVAHVHDGVLNAPALRTTLGGRIMVADRAFAMQGHLGAGASGDAAKGLPFEIVGGWDEPLLSLDVQALIQRSGAAAPLLGRQTAPVDTLSGTAQSDAR